MKWQKIVNKNCIQNKYIPRCPSSPAGRGNISPVFLITLIVDDRLEDLY